VNDSDNLQRILNEPEAHLFYSEISELLQAAGTSYSATLAKRGLLPPRDLPGFRTPNWSASQQWLFWKALAQHQKADISQLIFIPEWLSILFQNGLKQDYLHHFEAGGVWALDNNTLLPAAHLDCEITQDETGKCLVSGKVQLSSEQEITPEYVMMLASIKQETWVGVLHCRKRVTSRSRGRITVENLEFIPVCPMAHVKSQFLCQTQAGIWLSGMLRHSLNEYHRTETEALNTPHFNGQLTELNVQLDALEAAELRLLDPRSNYSSTAQHLGKLLSVIHTAVAIGELLVSSSGYGVLPNLSQSNNNLMAGGHRDNKMELYLQILALSSGPLNPDLIRDSLVRILSIDENPNLSI